MKKTNNTNNTKVTCPICGAEFAIAEHTHVGTGIVIGKDAGLGEIHPTLAGDSTFMTERTSPAQASAVDLKKSKADERLAALQAAGVDVSNLFAMQGATGNGMIARMTNGVLSVVDDNDPIFNAIRKGGMVPDRRLFRRWVMSQMFHMLSERDYRTKRLIGFTEALHRRGYEYQFKMLKDELSSQSRMFRNHDIECYAERNLWFNKEVVAALAQSYIANLTAYIEGLKVKKCKGVPYKKVGGRDIFCSDINSKVFVPLRLALGRINAATSPFQLQYAFQSFNGLRVALPYDTAQCPEWVKAYKGSGAYFTLKNMILFHGCFIYDNNGKHLSQAQSLAFIEARAKEYATEGWRMLALMKKTLEDNHIDVETKIAEWSNR